MTTAKIQIPTTSEVKGKKATMVIMNSIGLVVVRHVTLVDMKLQKPYQSAFNYNLAIWSIEKGKRSPKGFQYDQVAIFEGWQSIEQNKSNITIIAEFNDNKFEMAKSQFKNMIIEHESKKAYCHLYN